MLEYINIYDSHSREGALTERTRDLEVMLGDPKKAVLAMALPLILSYAVVQVNLFADTAWCAGLGSDASTALATIIPYYWILSGIGVGIGVGSAASIARHLGRGEREEAESSVVQTLVMSLVIGFAIIPVFYLSLDPVLSTMDLGSAAEGCRDYIIPEILFSPAIVLNGSVSGLLRAEGASRKSMAVLILAAVINMVLDPLFIYTAGMGLSGAGLATGLSMFISTLLGLYWYVAGRMYLKVDLRSYRPRFDQMKDILTVGAPRMVEMFFISSLSLTQRVIMMPTLGAISSAMYSVPWSYVNLVIVMSQACGAALIPVCSAAFGVKDPDKADKAFWYISKIALTVMTVTAAVIFIFADWFVIPFSMEESLVPYRDMYAYGLRVYMACIPMLAFVDLAGSYLQSQRLAQISMATAFVRNIILIAIICMCTTMEQVYWAVFAVEIIGGAMNLAFSRWGLARFRKYHCPSGS